LPTRYLNGGQVLSFRDYAFQTYYNNPRYLNLIHKKFGPEAASHIQKMAKNKLNRKYATYR